MTIHVLGSGKRDLADPAFTTPCPWLFEEDPPRFPYGGQYNPSPIAYSDYVVGMDNRFCAGTSAGPVFRRLDFLACPVDDETWPPASYPGIIMQSVYQPKDSSIPWNEYIPLMRPTRAQFIALGGTGELGTPEELDEVVIWNRGYCGGIHPAPYENNHDIHDNGDFALATFIWLGSEDRDRKITVDVTIDGVPAAKGQALVSLCYNPIDYNLATWWDPNNYAEPVDKNGQVVLRNALRYSLWGVTAMTPDYSYGAFDVVDTTAGDGVITLAIVTVGP